MIRLSRVGREHAIIYAIMALQLRGKFKVFTKGEICRRMGIKSTSKIRIILEGMVDCQMLVSGTTAIDGYADEIAIYGLPNYEQLPLPDHYININGEAHLMSEVNHVQYV